MHPISRNSWELWLVVLEAHDLGILMAEVWAFHMIFTMTLDCHDVGWKLLRLMYLEQLSVKMSQDVLEMTGFGEIWTKSLKRWSK